MIKDNENNEQIQGSTEKIMSKISLPQLEKILDEIYDFRLNIIENQVEVKEKLGDEFKAVNENSVYRELHHRKFPVSMNNLRYLLGSDFIEEYNPIREYFIEITKTYSKRKEDYIKKFLAYVKSPDIELIESSLKYWMVSSIRCVFDSNYFNKTVLVFFNNVQNSGKTTLARFLIPPSLIKYSSQNSLRGKDGLVGLYNTFIQLLDEMSEMHNMNKQEFKALISTSHVSVRPPYGVRRISRERITNFIGTSDRQSFLHEDVGTARFIVLDINEIDFSYSKEIEIDSLWAQAYSYFLKGEWFSLDRKHLLMIQEKNNRYMMGSVLTETIADLLCPGDDDSEDEFKQTKDILTYLYANSSLKNISERAISESLNNLKFRRISKYLPERKQSVYGYFVKFLPTRK